MTDVFISLRLSEARDKAQLLGEALRKRGFNSTFADPLGQWDRHADPSLKVKKLMNEADLVIVLATPLYGQSLRSHFGSKEELALIKLLHKPFFLIKACDKISEPGVRDLEFRQPDCFVWGMPDPGEPQLPGGLVESVIDALNEERGIYVGDEEDEEVAAAETEARLEEERAQAEAAASTRAKGRAGAARAAREAREEALREARLQEEATVGSHDGGGVPGASGAAAAAHRRSKTGQKPGGGGGIGMDFLKLSPDAMTLRGVCSMIDLLEQQQQQGGGGGGGCLSSSGVGGVDGAPATLVNATMLPGAEGVDAEGGGGGGGDGFGVGALAERPKTAPDHDRLGKEAVAWFRLAAEKHASRDATLLLANCLYGGVGAVGGQRDDEGAVKLLLKTLEPDKEQGPTDLPGGGGGAKEGKKKKKKKINKDTSNSNGATTEAAAAAGQEAGVGSEGGVPAAPAAAPAVLDIGGTDGGLLGVRHLEALTNLGECSYHGEGVRKDRPHAAKLYRQAAQLGYAPAQANLAEMFVKGEGVEKDDGSAFGWFAAAAAQGLAEGQHGLGACYESGDGVPVSSSGDGLPKADKALAAFWFEKAAVQGHQGAVEAAEKLEKALLR